MGSVNIDASILSKTGNQIIQVEMVEMQNGCICCTLKDEFMSEIERLSADQSIEAIFVEASGISEPSSIAGAFVNYEEMTPDTRVYLKTVVSVVDADRIYREFLHDLMSEDEKLSIEQGFMQFLNTLRFPVQLYVQSRTLNLREIIQDYRNRVDSLATDIEKLKEQ